MSELPQEPLYLPLYPEKGTVKHGPYDSIVNVHPEWMQLYLAEADSEESMETIATAIESRWQADQHGKAIEYAIERHRVGPYIADLMLTSVIDRWYFWPETSERQIRLTHYLNQRVEQLKQL
jgi:hypothetical protein